MRAVLFTILILAGVLSCGCDRSREEARDRVIDAMNAKVISVSTNQSAVLRLAKGYAAIVFSSVGETSTFEVFLSESGHFSRNQQPVTTGSFRESVISVGDARIYIGYNGEHASAVALDWEDVSTGIASSPTPSLEDISVSSLTFLTNRGFNSEDLLKSIGEQR